MKANLLRYETSVITALSAELFWLMDNIPFNKMLQLILLKVSRVAVTLYNGLPYHLIISTLASFHC
jgi:hypothetical protein